MATPSLSGVLKALATAAANQQASKLSLFNAKAEAELTDKQDRANLIVEQAKLREAQAAAQAKADESGEPAPTPDEMWPSPSQVRTDELGAFGNLGAQAASGPSDAAAAIAQAVSGGAGVRMAQAGGGMMGGVPQQGYDLTEGLGGTETSTTVQRPIWPKLSQGMGTVTTTTRPQLSGADILAARAQLATARERNAAMLNAANQESVKGLRKEFRTASKEYTARREAMETALATSNTPAGQIALVMSAAKAYDPGGRLSDQDVSQWRNFGGWFQKGANYIELAMSGNLSPENRADLIRQITDSYMSSIPSQRQNIEYMSALASRKGLDPFEVVGAEPTQSVEELRERVSKSLKTGGSYEDSHAPPEDAPAGSKYIGTNSKGLPLFVTPDKRIFVVEPD